MKNLRPFKCSEKSTVVFEICDADATGPHFELFLFSPHLKSVAASAAALLFLCLSWAAGSVSSQSVEGRVAEIRTKYTEVEERIKSAESAPEATELFVNRLFINSGNSPFPAVGIYHSEVRFYYSFGNREANPYPDQLLMVTVATKRSANVESAEYLFDDGGRFIFGFERENNLEKRYYLHNGKLIRMLVGDRQMPVGGAAAANAVRDLTKRVEKLRAVFRGSV